VQSSQRAATRRVGMIILDKANVQTIGFKRREIVCFRKVSAVVSQSPWNDLENAI
jgi:flagellar basal body rod protein FlgG